jgi:hypothetical protein
MARPIRIVVGEGRTAQHGLLRFVLEGEGFEVVGEANGPADLPDALAHRPDVVVLDDGIGVTAVSMVHEIAPQAKVVLVWPSAVVPVGGDARVEPAKILRDLGPAVQHVIAASAALTQTFERPDWIDKVRKDPATLRNKLLVGGAVAKRPSVTRLQRRGKRLHPKRRAKDGSELEHRDDVPAPVVVLPVAAAGAEAEPILDLAGADAAGAPNGETAEERSEWNRRLGTLALSGAAAVSALVLALALGGGRVPVSVLRGGGLLPPGVPGFVQGPGSVGVDGPFGVGALGGFGYDPEASARAHNRTPGSDLGGSTGTGFDEDPLGPGFVGGADEQPSVDEPGGNGRDGGNGGNGSGGDGGNGGGNGGNGGNGSGGDGGNGGGGGDGGSAPDSSLPGRSAEHNPHGGPPGQLGLTPAHGPGLGNGAAEEGPPGHGHKN